MLALTSGRLPSLEPQTRRLRRSLTVLAAVCLAPRPAPAQIVAPPDTGIVLTAARHWLTILDHGLYAESLDSAAPLLRQMAGTVDAWKALASQARAGFPPAPARELLAVDPSPDLPGAPAGRYVRVTFRVHTNTASVSELVVLQETLQGWRVAMYGTHPG